jgi:hypothetical protein
MTRIFVLAFFALNILVSCASHTCGVSNVPYQPATKPEKIEFARDRLDVFPDDVRKDPATHTNVTVMWAGIIRSTEAFEENSSSKIVADTVFEHHYFDWVQDGKGRGTKLSVSPRGEGLFCAKWHMDKIGDASCAESAEKYAGPGKLAIVYGIPEQVDTNGTVVLKYRYLRIFDTDHFTTNEVDYGRLGDHMCALTNAPSVKSH